MNEQWHTYLESIGAYFEQGFVSHYGNPDTECQSVLDNTIIADLSHYALICAKGEEAIDFLQNQLSNDVKLVDDNHSQISAYCSPKGRMLASFRIFKHQQEIYLRLPADTLEATLKRLRMFIMRSQVTLDDVSNDSVRFGICGDNAEALLSSQNLSVPTEVNDVSSSENITIIKVPGTKPRYEIYGAVDSITSLWEKLTNDSTTVGSSVWALQDIWSGTPDIFANTVEAFVPQMTNMHAINGVSFKKGCYPGQEVVARMQYLGKLKRRMFRGHVSTDAQPQPGDNLFNPEATDSIGKIVQSQPAPGGGFDLLAVLQIANTEKGSVHLVDANGPQVELIDLPYEVPLEREK